MNFGYSGLTVTITSEQDGFADRPSDPETGPE